MSAYSYIEYPADGLTTTFVVPFVYVNQTDVHTFINGVETPAVFTSPNTISIIPAPAAGAVVRLQRTTNISERAVDFVNGAVLTEEDLDTAFIQVFNAAQEAVDKTSETIAKDPAGSFNAQDRLIKNVADPVDPTDAANRRFVITQTASSVAAAAASAQAAGQSALQAAAQSNAAQQQANRAEVEANEAEISKNAATQQASNAATSYQQVLAAFEAAKLPSNLVGKSLQFLQVKADETGYVLVESVAAPVFFGLKLDQAELKLTSGRDEDFDVSEFDSWFLNENITLEIRNNNLVIVL